MKKLTKYGALVTVLILSGAAFGQAQQTSVKSAAVEQAPAMTVKPVQVPPGVTDEAKLKSAIAQHQRVRSQLPAEYQVELDQLTGLVKKRLFAAPIGADLLTSAAQVVKEIIPDLTKAEANSLAEYALGGIIAGDDVIDSAARQSTGMKKATKSMQETQMSFNLQYLQLQSQMQSENRQYTTVSNVLKTKHDAVKNSINNIR